MFSGIIKDKTKILGINKGVFTVENIFNNDNNLKIGDSVAHDGACMTITEISNEKYSFFVMEESINKTNFSHKKIGDYFNIEGSLKLSDSLDGHFVTGHVDTTGIIKKLDTKNDASKIIHVAFDEKHVNLIINKGSITINGVSLTIVDDGKDFLSVSIIPLTQEITNLGLLKTGDIVNLEFDMIGKYINKIHSNS
ncbi:riboflavin synthase [Candidatus Gracilibacteria bacterium 28_42_T64]|nr:riboflavin synthase [Candidatus Gracilibacteria bacterium 28_42_T64]